MRTIIAFLLFVVLGLCGPGMSGVRAEEVITHFDSVIDVSKDGVLTVTETVSVISEGNKIRHGIYRDFPLTQRKDDGTILHVGFSIKSVLRDGEKEDYVTQSIPNGIRIFIGKPDVFINAGPHQFQLTYTTTRQIRYFDDHEELYWNVTGNQWAFPIDEATATVNLPDNVKAEKAAVFTGPVDSTERNASVSNLASAPFFKTTLPLDLHEGMTIIVGMPKGSILPPGKLAQFLGMLRDNRNLVLGLGGFLVVLVYYSLAWIRVGQDPYGGVIVPRWDAPDGLSPAMVNYIHRRGFSDGGWTALSAACLDLAVKGYIVIEDIKQSIGLTRTDKALPERLPSGAQSILAVIPSAGQTFTIEKATGKKVQALGNEFRAAIDKVGRGKYYRFNLGYVAFGIFLSVAAYASLLIFGDTTEEMIGFLIAPAFAAIFFGVMLTALAKVVLQGSNLAGKIVQLVMLVAMLATVGVIATSTLVSVLGSMAAMEDWALIIGAIAIVLVNGIAITILGAPTRDGARLMAGIEGLKRYLTLAEKQRMNMQGAPTMSPRHFETLLPYAVALGVEKPWSETFQTWLKSAAAGAAAASYQPVWYHGNRFDSNTFGRQMSGFSNSMASAMKSSLPAPPKSSSSGFSSGGSGGRSGGGGGGGGGGGW